jgi:hypothetical protein
MPVFRSASTDDSKNTTLFSFMPAIGLAFQPAKFGLPVCVSPDNIFVRFSASGIHSLNFFSFVPRRLALNELAVGFPCRPLADHLI